MKSEKIKRIVLVGVGGFGRTWVRLLASHPTFEVVGLVDFAQDAIGEARSALNLGESAVFPDLETALKTTRPHLVVDSTPPRFRLRWAKFAFAHGAHLIVAKPLAERLSDGLEMVRLAKESRRYLAVNQQQRYHIVAQTLARYIRKGRIGQHVCTYFSFFQRRGWTDRLVEVPSPLFVESSIHHFDLFRAVLDQTMVRVNAMGWTPPDIGAVGKTAGCAWLELADGSRIIYQGTRSGRNDLDTGYKTGWHGPWIIEGTEGVLRGSDAAGLFLNGELILSAEEIQSEMAKSNMNRSFFDAFLSAVSNGKPFALEGRENIHTLAATHAAEASIASGDWVEVDEMLR